MSKGRISSKNIFLAYKNGDKFIGTTNECAEHIKSKPKSVRYAINGSYTNGYFVKRIAETIVIYCIDTPDGKHHESEFVEDLQECVWYAPNSIARYCYQNFVLEDGTKFYCRREIRDIDKAIERAYFK